MKLVFVGDLSYICAIISFKNNFNYAYHHPKLQQQRNINPNL